ncbi:MULTISPECIES: hypothetical protein [unclassified Candidatus Tisiphia]|uniref:hypothetical protein n=1 Tax=unclassified Candidatus Tisiphia TaxID=2996318 RepID=UPI00312CB2C6
MIIDNPTNIIPYSHASLREATLVATKQSIKVIRNGLLRSAFPFHRNDVSLLDLLHKSKIVEGFLGETKPATFAYTDVCEERRRVSTTKSPTRLTYAVSLLWINANRVSYNLDIII